MRTEAVSAPALKLLAAINAFEASEVFPLALMPHLIQFFCDEKPTVRLVLPERIARGVDETFLEMGYCGAKSPISISAVGAHWGQLDRLPDAESTIGFTHTVLVFGSKPEVVSETLAEELRGDSTVVGRLLGYPECCVDAYPALSEVALSWPAHLIERTSPRLTVSMWCNRLASLWGGTCPTGELFPCNLNCPNAVRYGQRADKLLRDHGFGRLAAEIRRQSSRRIFWLDGEVVVGRMDHPLATEIRIHE